MTQTPQPEQPKFDPAAPHMRQPHLRPVRGFPAKAGEQVVLGLADARQISDRVVFMAPAVQYVLPKMDGSRNLDEIVAEVGHGLTRDALESIVAQLDSAGLLQGPTFEAMWSKIKADFDSLPILPPASTAAVADALANQVLGEDATEELKAETGAKRLREVMDEWMSAALKDAEDPSFDVLPKAIVAPHIDFPRGWMNYGAVWGRMRVVDRPDRVIILGTNHFGHGTGVVACDKGYETPLGICEADLDIIHQLRSHLGDLVFEHRYDHEREHSIEMQVTWVQHCLGADASGKHCKIFAALVHDPSVNNGESYDGKGIALDPFVKAMREILAGLPGKTLVISSADLSHVGPAFGDPQPLAGDSPEAQAARERVFRHDQEMLELVQQRKPDELVASLAWQQNPTRWCSTGNIVAAMLIAEPSNVRILNYAAAMDQEGMGMVSSFAAVMT